MTDAGVGRAPASLGRVPPAGLTDARLQAHWAAQVVAAAGSTLAEKRADDSHANMEWRASTGMLAGRPLERAAGASLALRVRDLALVVLDAQGSPAGELPLAGHTLDDAMAWASARLGAPLSRPGYAMPEHPCGHGAPFRPEPAAAFDELARWYDAAARALEGIASREKGASPVRCWPHHFDLATLVTVAASADPEHARTLGVGLSPGDTTYAEPYFYVTPWPYPEDRAAVPTLDGAGRWQREGWFGAVLTGSDLVAAGDAAPQAARLEAFLASALRACHVIVG